MRPPPTTRTAAAHALELAQCLAKTRTTPQGTTAAGRSVEAHCRIAGAVAKELARRFEDACPGLLPAGSELPALVHDVGKVCPTFQAKIYDAAQKPRPPALANEEEPDRERRWGGHATVSHAALRAFDSPASDAVARIAGSHHGKNISRQHAAYRADAEIFGSQAWQDVREELLRRLLGSAHWPQMDDKERERMLCGLTIAADWIASGALFDDPHEDWPPLITQALDEAGFCWPQVLPGLSFQDIFGFAPRPAQSALIDAIQDPGVYVLEAPMGLGKTEAALYAAYRMLEQRKSSGIYFALPTRLTSNRIHARVDTFLERIFAGHESALLLHGQAWLERFARQQFGTVGNETDASAQDDMPDLSWFQQGKRGILAPFAVGTVDQALLSAMHVRHGALRTFGLAGKTVILDEVHSYDAYTGSILDVLVKQLRCLNCTVIILSATLTAERRAALLGATSASTAYPLISAAPLAGTPASIACEAPNAAETTLGHPASDEDAMEEALLRAEGGQRVLWIENTVGEAQARWRLLAARAKEMGDLPCGLLHSRFTPADREQVETHWVAQFAHDAPKRGTRGALLVGTQVVEQSLDLDADFLITRFCPTDMLLQRLGRLWRHADTQRPHGAQREAWLLHPTLTRAQEAPQAAFGGSSFVYAPYVLARSLEQWHNLRAITLPSGIRPIIEATYAERSENSLPAMQKEKEELRKKSEKLKTYALGAASQTQPELEDNDDNLPTRWSERKELSVLLLRHWDKANRRLTLADGSEMVLPQNGQRRWRSEEAARLLNNVVRISVSEKSKPEKVPVPQENAPTEFAPWINCQQVHVALIDKSGAVMDLHEKQPLPRNPHYDAETGYSFERAKKH